jgi:hypothetical protein
MQKSILLFNLLLLLNNAFSQDSFTLNYECYSNVRVDNGKATFSKGIPTEMTVFFNVGKDRNIITITNGEKNTYLRKKEDFEFETPKGIKSKMIVTELNGELRVFQLLETLNLRIMSSDPSYFTEFSCLADFDNGRD